jgi:lysyl-tRNA synthetase class 2
MDIEFLQQRAGIIKSVRNFFDNRNYIETDTPLLAPHLIPESCLEVFETCYLRPEGSVLQKAKPYWLIPSPEIWMKQLIAAHHKNIYQICKCFRNGESTGYLHSPEFTMLEYYTMESDYNDSLNLTEELFSFLVKQNQCEDARLQPPFIKITMEEAFFQWAGFDLYKTAAMGVGAMMEEARRFNLHPIADTSLEGALDGGISLEMLYNMIFVHQIEPNLPKDKTVALMDYPAFVPCLAQKHKNGNSMERWELYIGGIELANCYSEECNPEHVKQFFISEQKAKQQHALVNHNIDENYWKIFNNFPKCSGTALGLDRLIMAMTGRSTIDSVLPFPMNGKDS